MPRAGRTASTPAEPSRYVRVAAREEQVIEDEDRYRTDAQKEWARWAAHGYAKRWQPRSILWFGAVFTVVMIAALFTVFWLAAHGRL